MLKVLTHIQKKLRWIEQENMPLMALYVTIYTLPVLTTLEILLPNFVSFELWNISKKINKSEWPTYSQDGIWFEKMSNDWLKL